MKRPLLTAVASSFAAVFAASSILVATGSISSATALSVESRAPARAAASDVAMLPPPVALIEPSNAADNPIVGESVDAGLADAAPPPPPLPPKLTDDPPSDERTRRPERAEWKKASTVRIARAWDSRCETRRIREWVSVQCMVPGVTGFSLIAGTKDGVDFRMNTAEGSDNSITFEFPLRRGDRRVFQVNAFAGKYGTSPVLLISERWSDADEAPIITVSPAF